MRGVYSSRPAEKVLFRELFTNPSTVHRNGGVLTGSPAIKNGITLDGSTQHAAYSIAPTLLGRPEITFDTEFIPDFEADDDVAYFIYDTVPSLQYSAAKLQANSLRAYVGGVTFTAPLASYQPYWLVGKRNRLMVAVSGSFKRMWLNGNLVVSAGGYTPTLTSTALEIGRRSTGINHFPGRILSLTAHGLQFTQLDVDAIEDGSLFTYRNRATVWFDMAESTARIDIPANELLTDGDMEAAGVGDWTVGNDATLTKETTDPYEGSQALRVAYNTMAHPYASQPSVLTIGQRYRLRVAIRSDGIALGRVYGGFSIAAATSSISWQLFDVVFTALQTYLWLQTIGTAGYTEFDIISVREVLDQTLDKGPLGKVLQLGDGQGTGKPAFVPGGGFDFDGATYYLTIPRAGGVYNNVEQSIVVAVSPDFSLTDGLNHYLYDSSSSNRYLAVKNSADNLNVFLGDADIVTVALNVYAKYWRTLGLNVLIVAGATGNTNVWLNGFKIVDADNTAWSPANPGEVYLGTRLNLSSFFKGKILHFSSYDFLLGDIQVKDLTIALGVPA